MRNARFWQWVKGGWVKLTLEPGQSLSWHTGGYHDEGYSYEGKTWSLSDDGQDITLDMNSGGTDCDGRHEQYSERIASADPATFIDYSGDGVVQPHWQDVSAHQRDHFAEAMGY